MRAGRRGWGACPAWVCAVWGKAGWRFAGACGGGAVRCMCVLCRAGAVWRVGIRVKGKCCSEGECAWQLLRCVLCVGRGGGGESLQRHRARQLAESQLLRQMLQALIIVTILTSRAILLL